MKTTRIKIVGKGSAVYLLKHKGKVVYVGQSKNVIARFHGHVNKRFDEIEIIWCGRGALSKKEHQLIEKYRPIMNSQSSKPAYDGMQIRLSDYNEQMLLEFISKSKEVDPNYNMTPQQVFNDMLSETLKRELARFKVSKTIDGGRYLMDVKTNTFLKWNSLLLVWQPALDDEILQCKKRFERKKP